MSEEGKQLNQAADLRRRAEAKDRENMEPAPENIDQLSPKEIQQILHDLRVHQIELEMQNEELRLAQNQLEAIKERYFDLWDLAPVGYCTLSEKGLIEEINLTGSALLGTARSELTGRPLRRFILAEDQNAYSVMLEKILHAKGPQICELRLLTKDQTTVWLRLDAILAGEEGATGSCKLTFIDISERKRNEAALAESEHKYRTLADSGQALIWTSGQDKLCNYFNTPWLNFTGRTLAQELGNGWTQGVHPEDYNRCRRTYVEAFDKQAPFSMEYRLRHVGGQYRWLQDDGTPRFDGTGNFLGYIGHCLDITERKQAEEALRRNLSMLARTEHIANIGSWEWDVESDCTRWSDELFRIFQVDPAFGAPSLAEHPDIYVAEDMERLWAAVEMCITNGAPYELELRAIRTDGMIRQCVARGKAECDEKGRIIRLVGSLQDITEHKQAENELRQSESLSRTLVNTIPDLIWLKDADGVYLSCNKRFERFFGASEAEIRGKNDYDFVDEEMADSFRENDQKALAVGVPSRNEEQITDADDGHTIFLETIKTPMFGSDGNLVGVLGIGRDITERKQAEEALKEASMRVSLATKAGGVGVWEYDLVHDRLQWDEQMYALYGISGDAFGGVYDYWRAGVHPDDVARCDQEVAVALRGEKEFSTEFRVVWPDGTVRHIQALAMVLRDADGNPLRMIGTNWDITERKRIEILLLESEKKWREILINIPQIGLSLDRNARIVFANNHFQALTGWAEDELLGMDWFDMFIPGEIRVEMRAVFATIMQTGNTQGMSSYENDILIKNGDRRYVAWSNVVTKDVNDVIVDVTCLGVDLTERKRAEEKLRHSHELMSYIIKHNTSALAVHDKDFKYLFVSERYLENYKVKDRDVIGKHHYDVFPDLPQKWRDVHQKALAGITSSAKNDRYDREDGSVEWTTWECRPWYESSGNIGGFVVYTDIVTEQIKAQEEKLLLQQQLHQAQKMEAIGTLAGGIAHDFNNILGAILGYSEMIRDDFPPGSPGLHDINQVVKASYRAKDLVNQILAFSRQAEGHTIPMQPAVIVREVINLLHSSLPTTIVIKHDINPDAGIVLADPTQFHQIVLNLCTNAFHAMEIKGGTLTIALHKITLSREDLATESDLQPGTFVQLSIRDTGEGIRPEIWEKIYDPFFTTKEVGKGTGLGLAMVYSIVKRCGGSIACESRLGEGTEFRIILPALEGHALQENESTDLTPHGKEHILLIDDEEMLLQLGQTMLERLGYHVTTRGNSLDALTTFQNQPDAFDMVITDQTMPGMTGADLARRILQIRPEMPIILCTGYSSLITEDKAKAAGIKGFASKPLAKKDIGALIRKILDGEKQ